MDQHPIPRQITTFEFKLIGFMTLKQFLYLLVFLPLAFVVFKLFPIPLLNIILALAVAGFGVALAFLPINDRPLDVWVRNFFKRLTSPTQYTFHKDNSPLYFLQDLYFLADPHRVVSHIESKEKLSQYLAKTQPKRVVPTQKNQIQSLLRQPTSMVQVQVQPLQPPAQQVVQPIKMVPPAASQSQVPVQQVVVAPSVPQTTPISTLQPVPATSQVQTVAMQHPFLTGIVKNNKQIPLPGVLVYIKNEQGTPLRLLKTNPHGIFATYNPLPEGDFMFEVKDPNGGYFFDTMKVHIPNSENRPYEFYSKEMM